LRAPQLPYKSKWLPLDALPLPASVQKADERLREFEFTPSGIERNVYRPFKLNQTVWVYHNAAGSIYAADPVEVDL